MAAFGGIQLGVGDGVAVEVAVRVWVGVAVGEAVEVGVVEGVAVGVRVGVAVAVGVRSRRGCAGWGKRAGGRRCAGDGGRIGDGRRASRRIGGRRRPRCISGWCWGHGRHCHASSQNGCRKMWTENGLHFAQLKMAGWFPVRSSFILRSATLFLPYHHLNKKKLPTLTHDMF